MQRSPLLVLVALLTLGMPTPRGALAAEPSPVLGRIVKKGLLRVGMSGIQPPLNFVGRSGEWMGLEVDLARALAALMEVELRIVRKPFSELIEAIEKGEVDLVMSGMTITAERNLRVNFVGPYFVSGKSILTRSPQLASAESHRDLNLLGNRYAALAGSTSERYVRLLLPQAELVSTPDYDTALGLLLANEVQALVADHEVVVLTDFRNRDQRLLRLQRPLTVESIGIAVAPGDPQLVNFLENTLEGLERADAMNKLRTQWIERGAWTAELP